MLQLSGSTELGMISNRAVSIDPTQALDLKTSSFVPVENKVNEVIPGSLPIGWSSTSDERTVQIMAVIQESVDVKSFYLQPLSQDMRPLSRFHPGQHLPIRLLTKDGTEVQRTYSLTGPPSLDGFNTDYYRISVKRDSQDLASCMLHDDMNVGDILEISHPTGDFILPAAMAHDVSSQGTSHTHQEEEEKQWDQGDVSARTLVLLSAGIGISPLLSMLHAASSIDSTASRKYNYKRIVWIHGARDGKHHPFQDEVQQVKKSSIDIPVETHIRYSQPTEADDAQYDSKGRIDASLILSMLRSELDVWNADYCLCGPSSFMSEMEDNLNQLGVDPDSIYIESF